MLLKLLISASRRLPQQAREQVLQPEQVEQARIAQGLPAQVRLEPERLERVRSEGVLCALPEQYVGQEPFVA
jgi:hypothetical protein